MHRETGGLAFFVSFTAKMELLQQIDFDLTLLSVISYMKLKKKYLCQLYFLIKN